MKGEGACLRRGLDGTLPRQVTRLPAVIAVHLARLTALHRHVADLTAPARNQTHLIITRAIIIIIIIVHWFIIHAHYFY